MDHLLECDWRTHPTFREEAEADKDELDKAVSTRDYTRLELLGGRLVDFHLTELAFEIEPGMTASKVKAIVENINQVWMAEIARDYGLVKALRAPEQTKELIARKASVCASLLRAYIARLHTDGDLDASVHPDAEGRHRRSTRKFVRQLFKPIINIERERLRNLEERDASSEFAISRLTQWVQEHHKGLKATYQAEGIAPSETFCCRLALDEHVAEGFGGSKKEARRAAAEVLVAALGIP